MRTMITGGAGFLGSHLCDYFLEKGHDVICIDNLLTGAVQNIEHCMGNPKFKFIKHNVSEYIYVGGEIDNVLHFASPASPLDYLKLPIQTLKVGSLGTLNAIGVAKQKKAKFFLASTSEVYGDPLVHPQKEDYWGNVNPVGPRGVYDEAKRFSEAMVMAYHRSHGVDTRIIRIFNTYGPRMRINDGRALPAFISQAINGEDLTVFGDGSQTRSFCYVSDLVEGIYRLLVSDVNDPVNIPQLTELHSNYPNPFNPTTTIKFDVQDNETATLTIFNVKGQIVQNRSFESGTHNFEWNAQNVSSGVYYYQLKSSSYTNTKKMILLK